MWMLPILSFVLCGGVDSARILGVFMTPSYSHQIMFQPIWKELSKRGHEVTIYTPLPLNDPSLTNLTEIDIQLKFSDSTEDAKFDASKWLELFNNTAEVLLQGHLMQDLIKNANNDTYDLFLVEALWSSLYAFKDIYQVPMVGISSISLTGGSLLTLGMDRHPVTEPDFLLGFMRAKTLKERLMSWGFNWLYNLLLIIKFVPMMQRQVTTYFPTVNKSVEQLSKEMDVLIGNYNFASSIIRLSAPKFIGVSALHISQPKALPKELEAFINSTTNDLIYFSFGTNVKTSRLLNSSLNKFFNVFGELPYTVLYKYNDPMPNNLPKNFYPQKWFPQQDLLAHPKVKLFITQGGIQSVDEAIYREVPMLIVPFIADQRQNADISVTKGIAEFIDFSDFTEEELVRKAKQLLNNPQYKENIKVLHKIASDQPMSALDTAIYWIEYVIRHKGAQHLKYPLVDLPFYQRYLIDVYLVVGTSFIILLYVVKKVLTLVFRRVLKLFSGKSTKIKSS